MFNFIVDQQLMNPKYGLVELRGEKKYFYHKCSVFLSAADFANCFGG